MRVLNRLFASSSAIVAIATLACLSSPTPANAQLPDAHVDSFHATKHWYAPIYAYVDDVDWQFDLY